MSKERCKFCGTEIEWEESDDVCGAIWGCDECMEYFCEKCFAERCGNTALAEMLHNDERRILCPDCLAKEG